MPDPAGVHALRRLLPQAHQLGREVHALRQAVLVQLRMLRRRVQLLGAVEALAGGGHEHRRRLRAAVDGGDQGARGLDAGADDLGAVGVVPAPPQTKDVHPGQVHHAIAGRQALLRQRRPGDPVRPAGARDPGDTVAAVAQRGRQRAADEAAAAANHVMTP